MLHKGKGTPMPSNNTNTAITLQALDHPVTITRFPSQRALAKKELDLSVRKLAGWIEGQKAASKDKLPWLKLATFGDAKSAKGCLRTNANVATITGLEADYDAGRIKPEAARARLAKAGVAALIYTTPNHTPDAPRWRVLCPFSGPLPPDAREDLMARLNGVLGGGLDPASFTLSQAYYAGGVEGGSKVKTYLADGDFIDNVEGLKPIYKDGGKTKPERGESTGAKTGLSLANFHDALMHIPNNESVDRPEWLKIMGGVHHETDGSEEGLDMVLEWSEPHPDFDSVETERVWHSLSHKEGGTTGATVIAQAKFHGNWADLSLLDDEPEGELDPVTLADIDRMLFGEEDDQPKSHLTFLSPSECEDMPSRSYVIKGLLAEGDIATIVGAPGAGKSLLAPYLGFMVARGELAFGRRTRQGGVFYVAAEDGHGMRARLKALREEHGEAEAFKLVAGVSDLLTPKGLDLKALVGAVKAQRPALIVIDTLAVAFPGLEENDAKGMGRVVAVARHLTKWGAAVILIHHDTKDGSNGLPRGHSLLNGALDSNLYLSRKDGLVTGQLTKNRNGSTDEKLAFTVAVMPLGEDEDGDPKTAAFCREAGVDDAPAKETKLSPSATAALTVFHEVGDGGPVDENRWRDSAIADRRVSAAEDRDGRRRTFKRAVEELARKNVLVFHEGQFSVADSPERWLTDDDV